MQTLWSRVAQTQSSCRCRICLHTTNALTRRSATATSRRKITVADLFTACYTTILGTATIIDARRKNERRRQLDRQLDRARASLHQLVVGSSQGALDDRGVLDGGTSTTSQLVRDITSWAAGKSVRLLQEDLQSLSNIAHRPAARPSWMLDQLSWRHIEAAVAAEEQDPDTALREPRTSDHLAQTTATVLDLVDELLRRTETIASPRARDQADIPDQAGDDILKELEWLRQGPDFPSYQYPAIDPSYSTRIRTLLNESIRLVFYQDTTSREIVGKICYNLLTAGVPPTIHTYNTLIVGFNRIQRQDLAEAVIDSYLCQTNWPATDQTVVCLLAHYRRPGGRKGMRDAIKRLWGARVNGLRLAALDRDSNSPHFLTLKWKHSQRGRGTHLRKDNSATFDHLIRGWLYHGELDFACRSFMACLRNGSTIPLYTLQELFRRCLATAGFANARKLLVGITHNFENFQLCLLKIVKSNATAAVQELLRSLCQIVNICWLPFGEIFGETYQRCASAATLLLSMIRRLDVQLEVKERARLPVLLSNALSTDEPLSTRLQLAISTLDAVDTIRQTEGIYDDCIRIARVISIDRRYRDLEERAKDIVAAYNGAIISINTGYDIHARSLLLSGPNTPTSRNKHLALRRALNQLNVCDGSLTLEKVAWQLFRQIPNQDVIRQLEQNGNWKRLSIPVLVSFYCDNAASPRSIERNTKELDNPYEQLHNQIREARDSIRALIFTYLSPKSQSRGMSHYGSYYSIPLSRLRSHLHRELKYGSSSVHRDFPPYEPPLVPHTTSKPLLFSGPEEPVIRNIFTPFEADSSTLDMRYDLVKSWGNGRRHQKYEDLSILGEEDPRLQYTALG
ncbi:hypothetical protein EV127DRAFT_441853 [Xylaria flabelliformis]|nr:hypothetical protein EV127DRAFT_441853 [Xylaria flabelliformis]